MGKVIFAMDDNAQFHGILRIHPLPLHTLGQILTLLLILNNTGHHIYPLWHQWAWLSSSSGESGDWGCGYTGSCLWLLDQEASNVSTSWSCSGVARIYATAVKAPQRAFSSRDREYACSTLSHPFSLPHSTPGMPFSSSYTGNGKAFSLTKVKYKVALADQRKALLV